MFRRSLSVVMALVILEILLARFSVVRFFSHPTEMGSQDLMRLRLD